MKKIFTSLLSVALIFSLATPCFVSGSISSSESPAESVQEILSDFNFKSLKLAMSHLTGLQPVHFMSSNDSSAIYHGGSSWARVFTQVWDNNYNQWVSGSSVESVAQLCYVDGVRYDSSKKQCVPYESLNKTVTTPSDNYSNSKWRNDNAVIAFKGAIPGIHDPSGDAFYVYDSKVIITHRDGFL